MKKLFLSLVCCTALIFASCSDDDDKTPEVKEKTTAKEFIEKNRESAKQEIEVNASELPKTFTFKEKVKITIPADALLKDGTPITGKFTLEVYEMLRPASIVLSGTNTNLMPAYRRYLETDGFIYVNVKQNGNYIDAKLGKNLTIAIPTDKEDGAETMLWTGVENAGPEENQFSWQVLNDDDIIRDDNDGEFPNQDFNTVFANNGHFEFSFGKLGWCNCDFPWGDGKELTTVTVELTGKVGKLASYLGGSGDTFVFFAGKGYPVVVQLYTDEYGGLATMAESTKTIVKSYNNSMPVGVQGKMFAFSIQEGIFAYASQDITISKDMEMTLDLKEVSSSDLTNKLKDLDGYK